MTKEQIELYRNQGKLQEIIRELDFIFNELIDEGNQEHLILHNLFQDVWERLADMAGVME